LAIFKQAASTIDPRKRRGTSAMSEELQQLLERVEKLEKDVFVLKNHGANDLPWWERIAGRFENDPVFDEIVRLGRQYRESLRPEDE
jgi:hypothetical protein